tara:strand:- start:13001 stop:14656 length:1656 start_codon:yes stop_codon:yes gene_type:complete
MSFVKYHLPCPKCGGSDPVSVDEKGNGYCFSCQTYLKDYDGENETVSDIKTYQRNSMNTSQGSFNELTDRGISLDTAKKYGVKSILNSDGSINSHIYPYFISNEMVGTKKRSVENKEFLWQGTTKGTILFGQNLFGNKGKFVTLTEGECDAMAAYQMLGSKWPVVSIKNGAGGAVKDVKENLEFLEAFEYVVIAFDSDKVGQDSARRVARVLKPGKAKILTLPEGFKDPNDILKQGRTQTFVTSWWDSKIYTPSGVLNISDNLEKYHNREKKESIPYPWEGLNNKLYGMRQGELITLTGGTGLGKSTVTREIEHWLISHTKDAVGIMALEESWRRTVDGIISIEANARLYIDQVREQYTKEQLDGYLSKMYNGDNKNRVWVHAHLGIHDIDEIFSKLRFMIIGCGCKWIVVDHLHMLVSSLEGDERRAIDNIMTRLRSLVEETGVGLILVAHPRRVDGNRGHENGAEINLSHLRGSQSIAQLSDCVLALARNQMATDKEVANTTQMVVLKSRYTGDVGIATSLVYSNETGRLTEVFDDSDDDETNDDNIPF